jgi:hypothetical protein
MKNFFSWIGIALIFSCGGVACQSSPIASLTPVNNILAQWNINSINQILQTKPRNTIVTLRGKVQAIAPLVGSSAYQLQDASGSIWVLTNNPNALKVGDVILMKGQTRYEVILIAGQDQGEIYIQEQEILERQTPLQTSPARPQGTNLLPNNRPSP